GRGPELLRLQPAGDPLLRVRDVETIQRDPVVGGRGRYAVPDERLLPLARRDLGADALLLEPRHRRLDDAPDRQLELLRELEVALGVGRHGPDRPGPRAQHTLS